MWRFYHVYQNENIQKMYFRIYYVLRTQSKWYWTFSKWIVHNSAQSLYTKSLKTSEYKKTFRNASSREISIWNIDKEQDYLLGWFNQSKKSHWVWVWLSENSEKNKTCILQNSTCILLNLGQNSFFFHKISASQRSEPTALCSNMYEEDTNKWITKNITQTTERVV